MRAVKPIFIVCCTLLAAPALQAVYAPIPEAARDSAWTFTVGGGVSHDSNIFGGATGAIESVVWRIAPSVSFNASLTDQTFFSAGYDLSVDYVEDRPQNQELTNHNVFLRLAHAFSSRTNIDLVESYSVAQNPESLLAGVPLNTDQSYQRNQFDARLTSALSERLGLTVKARSVLFAYDTPALADQLDRSEALIGIEGAYALRPTLKLVGEYRYQNISYDESGETKDKDSHYVLGGADYAVGEKLSVSSRVGAEFRRRSGAAEQTAPYVELSGRYAFSEFGYVAGGAAYTLEETSNLDLYTDTQVQRWFINVQHPLSARVVASGTLNYEPSVLQGRSGVSPDRDETTVRFGAALTYLAARGWSISLTFDQDNVYSDDPNRDLERTRFGAEARRMF